MPISWSYSLRGPAEFTFSPKSHNTVTASFADGSTEVWPRWFAWTAVADWPVMSHAQYHALMALLAQAEGRASAIKVPLFHYRAPLGTKAGGVSFLAATAGATALTVTGGTGAFAAGDFIQINQATGVPRAYMVVAAESGGVIQIKPGLARTYTGTGVLNHIGNVNPPSSFLEETMELTSDLGAAIFPSVEPNHFRGLAASFESTRKPSP